MFFFKAWIIIKIIYLYLLYWFVGLTQGDFYLSKANYFADLGFYSSAIKYYKKSLSDTKSPMIFASIGWCYLQIDNYEMAVEYYNKAYQKMKSPVIILGLALSEYELGHYEITEKLCNELNEQIKELPKNISDTLMELRVKLKSNAIAR